MRSSSWGPRTLVVLVLVPLALADAAAADEADGGEGRAPTTEALARAAQNPVADMMTFPFQDNIGLGYGPGHQGTQNVLNFQPVIPVRVAEGWNVITRTI